MRTSWLTIWEAQIGACLCFRTLWKNLPEGFSEWSWPFNDLQSDSLPDPWTELIKWLNDSLGLKIDVQEDDSAMKLFKGAMKGLSWRGVEELLLNIGLVMRQGARQRNKKWQSRKVQAETLCSILLDVWRDIGYVMIDLAI